MKHRIPRILPLLSALLVLTACGQNAEESAREQDASQPVVSEQGIPFASDFLPKEGWPFELAPAELPEYAAGTITASAVDDEGVLTIKVADTNESDLYTYLGTLQNAGWLVTSDDTEAEALLGLYTVSFRLQGDDTVLQIDVYTEEAGVWPSDILPPDVLPPEKGTLAGEVEVLETAENMWYFNYTYDGIDEEAAGEYIELLLKSGWRGDADQLYKNFEWNGKNYEATIEIYETVENRTTFTCNFYLSAAEPSVQASVILTAEADASVVGSWVLGTLSGGQFNADTGKYEGGAAGMGQIYTFKPDGAYTALVIWEDTARFTGNYIISDGLLTLTGRVVEESEDGGRTWGPPSSLPDASAYFAAGTDEIGAYLLIGEEGGELPLVDKENSVKYRWTDS